MAKDLFNPARFTNCGLLCAKTNPYKTGSVHTASEQNKFISVLQKVTGINASSNTAAKYLKRAAKLVEVSNRIYGSKYVPDGWKKGITKVRETLFPGEDKLLKTMEKFNPVAFSNVVSGMEDVADRVRSGRLKLKDVKGLVNDIGNLANAAQDLLSGDSPVNPENSCFCDKPINYARFVADWYFPKYSSLYVVQFIMNGDLQGSQDGSSTTSPVDETQQGRFAFLCTKVSRPGIKFDTQEVNRYNTRIHVHTKSKFDDLTLEFVDDDRNTVHAAYTTLMSYYTPNANFSGNITYNSLFNFANVGNGLSNATTMFSDNQTVFSSSVAEMNRFHTGKLGQVEIAPPSNSSAIHSIVVYHLFRFGNKLNKYTYYNPIIKEMSLTDLDTTGDTISSANMTFDFANMTFDEFDIANNKIEFDQIRKLVAVPEAEEWSDVSPDVKIEYGISSASVLGGNNTTEMKLSRLQTVEGFKNRKKSLKERMKEGIKNFLDKMAKDIKNKIMNSKLVQSVKSGLNKLKENVKQFEAKSAGVIKFPGSDNIFVETATSEINAAVPSNFNFNLSGTPVPLGQINLDINKDAFVDKLGIDLKAPAISIKSEDLDRLKKGIF